MITYHFGRQEQHIKRFDFITCGLSRHHVYKKNEGQIELTELGPRFEMKCKSTRLVNVVDHSCVLVYQIKLGTIDQLDACDTEWQYRPFMNTTKKRQFLATETDKE